MSEIQIGGRTRDPETGYICRNSLGKDYGPEVRCRRCGGRGMWKPVGAEGNKDFDDVILCLRCADHWDKYGLLEKHGYVSSKKKWLAAFNEFCQMEPESVDVEAHNRSIESDDKVIQAMFPQFF